MAAPGLTFAVSGSKISAASGFDCITVVFSADLPYTAFQCRATRAGEDYGVEKGTLIASFSSTPAGVERTFEIYDDYLTAGDGAYRISLFARGADGSWNDNDGFIPSGSAESMLDADGLEFLCMR